MPWTADDSTRHTKLATTSELQSKWAETANRALERGLSEGAAVRSANFVLRSIATGRAKRRGSRKISPRQARWALKQSSKKD